MCDFSVTQLVEDFLRIKSVQDNFRDNSHFHPSEFHGCKRLAVYKYYLQNGTIKAPGIVEKIEPTTQRIFDNGHHVHARWGSYLEDNRCAGGLLKACWKCKNAYAHEFAWKVDKKRTKESCFPKIYGLDKKLGILKPEEPCEDCGCTDYQHTEIGFLDPETLMGGHIDALLFLPTGEHIIIDYKSIRKRLYDKIYDEPKPEHYMQMQCYLYVSELNYGKFIYECKDDQEVKEINVKRNEVIIKQIVEDAKILKKIVTTLKENGKWGLPPRSNSLNPMIDKKNGRTDIVEYNKSMAMCMRCMFRNHCWRL